MTIEEVLHIISQGEGVTIEFKDSRGGLLELVPSWVEKGLKSASKKLWYLIAILSLCAKATSATYIMHYIGYSSLKSFRTRYLMPLC